MLSSVRAANGYTRYRLFMCSTACFVALCLPFVANADMPASDQKIDIEVSKALFASGQQANDALNQLSAARAAAGAPRSQIASVDPATVPAALQRTITLSWNGRADRLVKRIASAVGYRYREIGPRPASPTIITTSFAHTPAVDALQQVGLRVNHTAAVSIDTASRTITYRRIQTTRGLSGALVSAARSGG